MKKIICILLMLLFVLPVTAEEDAFAPFILALPAEVTLEETEEARTFIHGSTRVVALHIDRLPDADPAQAVIRLMGQFDPAAVIGEDVPTVEGFSGVEAVTEDKYGAGVDALTVMILSHGGDLLILSGYNMDGSEVHVRALLDAILSGLTADGQPVVLKNN